MIAEMADYNDIMTKVLQYSRQGLMSEARLHAHEAMALATCFGDCPKRLAARLRLIWIEFQEGQHAVARAEAQAAITEAVCLGDPAGESVARSLLGRLMAEDLEIPESGDQAIEALRLARISADPIAFATASTLLAIVCSRLNLADAAVSFAEQAVIQSQISGDPEAIAHSIANQGSLHGDYLYRYAAKTPKERQTYLEFAIVKSREATALACLHGDGEMQRLPGYNLVEYLLAAGDLSGAELAMEAVQASAGVPSRRSAVHGSSAGALLVMAQNRTEEAIALLSETIERAIAFPFLEIAVFAALYLTDVFAKTKDFESAYRTHIRYHELYVLHADSGARRHLETAMVRQKIEEMVADIAAELKRAERLQEANEALVHATTHLAQEVQQDALTGIANRRAADRVLAALEFDGASYSIALIDVDRFKQVNDRFTHSVGDDVLREIAQMMTAVAQAAAPQALVARYGGEEFVVVLKGHQWRLAQQLCENLREAVASHDWSATVSDMPVTISIGLAKSQEATDIIGCLALADRRLYDAKSSGRNRLVAPQSDRRQNAP